jgi:hypothetical protein
MHLPQPVPLDAVVSASDPARRILAGIAWAVGTIMVIGYIAAFDVNVPINDDWDQVAVSVHWCQQGFDTASLLAPHNEHCLAIPRILSHAVLVLSQGNYRRLLLVNGMIGVAGLAVLLAFVSRWRMPLYAFIPLVLAIAALMSGWCQWQNWLWAFQMPWFLLPLMLIACATLVARARSAWVAVTVVAATALLGPLCMANGVFMGWALLPALWMRVAGAPRQTRWQTIAVTCAICLVATIFGLAVVSRSRTQHPAELAQALASPLQAASTCLAIIGGPLDPQGSFHGDRVIAMIAGAIALSLGCLAAIAGFLARRGRDARELGPGFALMTYGLLSVCSVVAGRLDLLANGPVESRYLTLSSVWTVGVLLTCGWLSMGLSSWVRMWRFVTIGASIMCILAVAAGTGLFLRHGKNMRLALEGHQLIYRNALAPGAKEQLQAISRHYGAEGLLTRIEGMRTAGILHQDYAPAQAPPGLHNSP